MYHITAAAATTHIIIISFNYVNLRITMIIGQNVYFENQLLV